MTDGGDDGMSAALGALEEFTVRDQWAEIARRADEGVNVVELTPRRRVDRRSRAWRVVAASLTAAALLAVGLLAGRAMSPVATDGPADRPAPPVAWTLGPATPVPSPDAAGLPLLAGVDGTVYAAFRGGSELVIEDGVARTERIDAEITAIAAARNGSSGTFAVVLTRDGALIRVDATGRRLVLAELGPVRSSTPSVAIASGKVFVAGSARGGLLAVDASRADRGRVVAHLQPTILAAHGNSVWALDQTSGELTRLLAPALRVTGTIRVRDVVAMSAGDDGLYLARPGVAMLSHVDARLALADLAHVDPSTTSVAAAPGEVWSTALDVVTAYAPENGQLIGALALPIMAAKALTFDGSATWVLGDGDGLRRLVPTP